MKLANHREAANTRAKLALIEAQYEAAKARAMPSEELRQLSLYALRRMINQLKEDLGRFECDVKAKRIPADAATA